ncbi:unnamed protein product [Rhizoctonia solani]|uniref:NmrA-like domain-containing protein n=1 Tax=Rhizoctonia solani TaxID=456999 RepID=A0A8H3H6T1_9AGAM|nr:unnamed protein product [Rhizoctonia solani]
MAAETVALAGANGFVGKAFATEFLNQGHDLRIITRPESINSAPLQEFKAKGAFLHAISYDDEASLVKALQGVDVLISTRCRLRTRFRPSPTDQGCHREVVLPQ